MRFAQGDDAVRLVLLGQDAVHAQRLRAVFTVGLDPLEGSSV